MDEKSKDTLEALIVSAIVVGLFLSNGCVGGGTTYEESGPSTTKSSGRVQGPTIGDSIEKNGFKVTLQGIDYDFPYVNVYEEGWINELVKENTSSDIKEEIKDLWVERHNTFVGEMNFTRRGEINKLLRKNYSEYMNKVFVVKYRFEVASENYRFKEGMEGVELYDEGLNKTYESVSTTSGGSLTFQESFIDEEVFNYSVTSTNHSIFLIIVTVPPSKLESVLEKYPIGCGTIPAMKTIQGCYVTSLEERDIEKVKDYDYVFVFKLTPKQIKENL